MHSISRRIRNIVFYLLVAVFAALAANFSMGPPWFSISLLVALALAFILLGLALIGLTLRLDEVRVEKVFFVLTGAAALAIPLCVILHNLVYGLLMVWLGEGVGDEAVFFILALFVCPALFLLGAGGSLVFLIKRWLGSKNKAA